MTKNKLGCRLAHYTDVQFDMQKVDPSADPTIIKRINDFQKLWMKLTRTPSTNPVKSASTVYWERVTRIGGIVEGRAYDPHFFNRIKTRSENVLRIFFNKVADLAPTPEKYKRFLERRGQGFVAEQLAQLEAAKRIDYSYKQLDEVFKANKIGEADRASLMWKSVEIGGEPWLLDYTIQTNPQAMRMLERNRDEFVFMMDNLGIPKSDQAKIVAAGKDVMQVYHEVLSVSGEIGVDTEMLHNLGYMNRVFTNEAANVINTVDNKGLLVRQTFKGDMSTAFFQKSRGYIDYVPQDNDVLDYLFQRGGLYDRINRKLDKSPELKAKLGKDKVNNIDDLLNGGEPVLLEAVVNQLHEDELRFLVQNGFLAKLPWETGRIHEYLAKNYKFPFDGIQEVFVSDPRKAFQLYKQTLETVASERGAVWGLIDGAVNEFGIPKSMLDPKIHQSFVPLRDAIPEEVLNKIIGRSRQAVDNLNNIYVNPEVARVFKADMTISTSPFWMGIMSDVFSAAKKVSQGLVLGSTQWFGRQVVGNAGHLLSYGVSPYGYFKDVSNYMVHEVGRMFNKESGLDYAKSLSNTKKVFGGGTLTERDIWRLGQRKGILGDYSAFGRRGEIKGERGLKQWKRSWNEFTWLMKNYPDHFGEQASRVVQALNADDAALFRYISWGNSLTDNMMKFNLLKSVMSDNRMFHRLNVDFMDSIPHIKDPNEAVKWVEKHAYMFDELPLDSDAMNIGSTVVPFLSWRIKNVQQTVRFAVEHPHLFGTYLELGMRGYDEFKDDKPVEWEAMTSGWVSEKDFPIPFVIPKDKSASGKDEYFIFPSTTINPMLGGVSEMGNWLDVLGLFGSDGAYDNPKNPYGKHKTIVQKVLSEESSPLISIMTQLATGEDKYGNSLENVGKKVRHRTLMGLPVEPNTYYWVTQFAPMVRNLEKTINGTEKLFGIEGEGVLGSAPQLDVTSGKFDIGSKTWAGQETDVLQSNQKEPFFAHGIPQGLAEIFGVAPMHIDVYMQQGYTQGEMEQQLRDAKSKLKGFNYKLAIETDPEGQAKLIKEYEDLMIWAMGVEYEYEIFNTWRKKLNLPSTRALQIIQEQDLAVPEVLPKKERDVIYKRIYDKYNSEYLK